MIQLRNVYEGLLITHINIIAMKKAIKFEVNSSDYQKLRSEARDKGISIAKLMRSKILKSDPLRW